MANPFSAAAVAYGNTAKLIPSGLTAPENGLPKVEGGPNFATLLAENVQSVVDSGARSDQLSMDLVNGKTDMVNVVTAIAETEMAIESMVAVRDRVISAYEEIMRMPI
jgi:flagellar hook-basal body complex protein FliE